MAQMNKTIKLFIGNEVMEILIKGEFEKNGIPSFIISDFNSGVTAGFSGGVPSETDLFIEKKDMETATTIIEELTKKHSPKSFKKHKLNRIA